MPVLGHNRPVALARILVDGYSLLHAWKALAPKQPRHSAASRDALIQALTCYHDASAIPVTIIFDGSGAPPGTPKVHSTREVEVLYAGGGKTADDLIERAAHRLLQHGDVLVVTNDYAERETISSLGGSAMSCRAFISEYTSMVADLRREVGYHNRRERQRFKDRR